MNVFIYHLEYYFRFLFHANLQKHKRAITQDSQHIIVLDRYGDNSCTTISLSRTKIENLKVFV